jgi:4-hydroxythreonine-4-phosphate dehydrogenase
MGDSSGVGPEILLSAAAKNQLAGDYIVAGDLSALEAVAQALRLPVKLRSIAEPSEYRPGAVNVLDAELLGDDDLKPGSITKISGAAALAYLDRATRLALEGKVSALVTLPMNKEATRLSLPTFSGHTEYIAELCGQSDYTMMLASDKLRVTHVSTHVSMAEAVAAVRKDRVRTVIALTRDALSAFIPEPRIAVAGLNPHAGENGSFGREDLEEIRPAVEACKAKGWKVSGPEAPDTVFFRAVRSAFDAVVCMYHDQGHIPMKLLDFEGGVNITLGLKVIRTSVDHGTAFDIAWQGKASTTSFLAAYEYARKMTGEKQT